MNKKKAPAEAGAFWTNHRSSEPDHLLMNNISS